MPEPTSSLLPSPTGMSAPLLSNPALTDTLSNFPLFSSRASSSRELERDVEDQPLEEIDVEDQTLGSTTPSSRTTSRANRQYTRPRGRMRPRAQSRAVERAMTLPNIPESTSPAQPGAEHISPSRAPPYQLRRSRAAKYRRGNRGSRNCSCVNLIEVRTPGKQLARGADPPAHDFADAETSEDHLQRTVRAIQAAGQSVPLVHHVVITIEKTYSSIEPVIVPPLETTLRERNIPYGLPHLPFQRVDLTRQERIRIHVSRYHFLTAPFDSVWKNRTRRRESSYHTLYKLRTSCGNKML